MVVRSLARNVAFCRLVRSLVRSNAVQHRKTQTFCMTAVGWHHQVCMICTLYCMYAAVRPLICFGPDCHLCTPAPEVSPGPPKCWNRPPNVRMTVVSMFDCTLPRNVPSKDSGIQVSGVGAQFLFFSLYARAPPPLGVKEITPPPRSSLTCIRR